MNANKNKFLFKVLIVLYGGPEVQPYSINHNFFLQSTTFFYKSQLFSTNHNFFLQIPTIFYKPQLFSTNRNYFLHSCNFFLQIATIFYILSASFYNIATFFYKPQLFSTIHNFFYKSQLFSAESQLFSTAEINESLVWIKEKSVISLVYHICREDSKWIASAESRRVREASHQPIFMGDCLTICHMCLPCLPGEWVSFCVPGAIAVSADAAWT